MFNKTKNNQYRVKAHNPWHAWIVVLAVALSLVLVTWLAYELGLVRAGYNNAAAKAEVQALEDEINIRDKRIEELLAENARLASDTVIGATANQQVSGNLRQLNEEILELKEELVFYRSLLSPSELEPGLQVLGVQLAKYGSASRYSYKIVLTQRRNRDRFAAGTVNLQFVGMQADKKVQLQAGDLIADREKALSFRFKNFQSLEGKLNLPKGFEPLSVLVTVLPKGKGLKQVKRSYEWNSIVTGG